MQTVISMGCIPALFVLFHLLCSLYAFDTVTRTQFISDSENQSLVSSDGNFKLGFFSPGKSQARYVGIWPNKITQRRVVWVANRETPINNSAGVFKIGEDGNPGIFCGDESSPLWSTNVSIRAGISTAKLLDSGNLVLVANEIIIWQSFDYPTDTIIPGMMFGFNRKTHFIHTLSSWKSIDDPSLGDFSCRFDLEGLPQFFVYKGSHPRWRFGPWNGRYHNGLQDLATIHQNYKVDYNRVAKIMNHTYTENKNEGYFWSTPPKKGSLFYISVIDQLGSLKMLIWDDNNKKWVRVWMDPHDLCDEYERCGANGICINGDACQCLPGFRYLVDSLYLKCEEKMKMDGCGKGDGEGFVRLERVKLPDVRNTSVHRNISLEECGRVCLKTCNCTGYAILDFTTTMPGCITWYGDLRDMRYYPDGQDFFLRVDAVELAAYARKNAKHSLATKHTLAFIILPISVEILLAVMCFCYFWRRNAKRKVQKHRQQLRKRLALDSAKTLSNFKEYPSSNIESGNIDLPSFKLATVATATDYFSPANKLGQGGFGPVYKGQLYNGQQIAVKILSKFSGQGNLEFENEVLLIAKLQHRNLVKLLGYCIEKNEKMLIYEFMPNKSLDYFIFDQLRNLLLDWKTRFGIILGIARGILYLHQDSRLTIIHRDLKASNILLDGEMKPKISDFGTARILKEDATQTNTKRVIGTYGYMSPEYALKGIFSTKSDVFSFGVIILEIISGKKNWGIFHDDDPYSNLIQYTWELWRVGRALEIVDSCIIDSCPSNEVLICIQVGLLCVQDNARGRPSMSTVVSMLSNEAILPSPTKSTFAIKKNEPNTSYTNRKCSINEVTITTADAR